MENKESKKPDLPDTELRHVWTSGKSKVISIPMPWFNSLPSDKIVVLSRYKDGYFIRPAEATKRSLETIQVPKGQSTNVLKYKIISAYLKGYQDVEVSFDVEPNDENKNSLFAMSTKLTGLDVSNISKSKFFVSMSTSPQSISKILKRMLSQATSLYDLNIKMLNSKKALSDEEERSLTGPIEIENDIDKNNFLVERLLAMAITQPDLANQLGIKDLTDAIHWKTISSNLERVGDMEFECYVEIKALIENKGERYGGQPLLNRIGDAKEYNFIKYYGKAQEMANDAYEKNIDKILESKRYKTSLDAPKTRSGYIDENNTREIERLIKETPELGRLDIRIWSITSCATNVAEAWRNIEGPTDKPTDQKQEEPNLQA